MEFSTTITKIGEKNTKLRTFEGERLRISLILCVYLIETKLQPLLIFKRSRNGRKENSHNNNPYVKMPRKCLGFRIIFFELLTEIWLGSTENLKHAVVLF